MLDLKGTIAILGKSLEPCEISIFNLAPSGEILSFDLISSSGEKVFDDSALAALSKIYFITEVIGLERKYFERNFRSFNLVFKSKNQ